MTMTTSLVGSISPFGIRIQESIIMVLWDCNSLILYKGIWYVKRSDVVLYIQEWYRKPDDTTSSHGSLNCLLIA